MEGAQKIADPAHCSAPGIKSLGIPPEARHSETRPESLGSRCHSMVIPPATSCSQGPATLESICYSNRMKGLAPVPSQVPNRARAVTDPVKVKGFRKLREDLGANFKNSA